MVFTVEIVAVGDELCYGRVYDTNSFWIAEQVTRLGAFVQRITCVRDDLEGLCTVLRDTLDRKPRFIFVTGGLGPTPDDRTLEALGSLTNRPIVVSPHIMKVIAERRGVAVEALPPHFAKMTSSLEGAECLPNPVGVAPVTLIPIGETVVAAMPGPPREVKECFAAHLAKRVQDATQYSSSARRVNVTMFESELTPLIATVMKSMPDVYIKPLVGEYKQEIGLPVEIIAFDKDSEACSKRYEVTLSMLRELVNQKGRKLTET